MAKIESVTPKMVGPDGKVRVRFQRGGKTVFRRVAPIDANEYVKCKCGEIDPDPADLASNGRTAEVVIDQAVGILSKVSSAKDDVDDEAPPADAVIPDLNDLPVAELRALAKAAKLNVAPEVRKPELVGMLGNMIGTLDEYTALRQAAGLGGGA